MKPLIQKNPPSQFQLKTDDMTAAILLLMNATVWRRFQYGDSVREAGGVKTFIVQSYFPLTV